MYKHKKDWFSKWNRINNGERFIIGKNIKNDLIILWDSRTTGDLSKKKTPLPNDVLIWFVKDETKLKVFAWDSFLNYCVGLLETIF